MKNKKLLLGLIILMFVFALSSCGEDIFTVPSWAQGKWSLNAGGLIAQLEAVTITSKEFRPTAELLSKPGFSTVLGNKKVTYSTNDKVVFDIITITKNGNPGDMIEI